MTVRLAQLLEPVLADEPELGDEVDAVFRRADRLRRRRTEIVLASGGVAAVAIVAAGFVLTKTLLPGREPVVRTVAPPAAESVAPSVVPSTSGDAVGRVIRPVIEAEGLHLLAGSRGQGWREYPVRDEDGRRRGTVQVAIYHVEDDLCFPVPAAPGKCARAEQASKGIEYVRYDDEQDPGRQVHQTIARRSGDGSTLVVMAAGERDTTAKRGKPSLSGKQVEKVTTDQSLFDAFAADERCGAGCPSFRVPVPVP